MGYIGIIASLFILVVGLLFLLWLVIDRAWRTSAELIYPVRRQPTTSPEDYGISAEPISFRTKDGTTLRGWFTRAIGPAKGTIVSCHGYAGDCSPDLVYAPLFNTAGYNVCFFDFRGHGTSEGSFTSLVYYEREDLLSALEFLQSRGIDRVGLIGFSMGGAVALSAAPASPIVIGVVSDCTFSELNRIIRNAALQRRVPPPLAGLIGWLVESLAGLRLDANLFSADPIHAISKISPCPVLIMHGEADDAVPVSEAFRLYHAAREPKQLWIVPGAGHRAIEDVAPDEYRRRVVDFFDRAFHSSAPFSE